MTSRGSCADTSCNVHSPSKTRQYLSVEGALPPSVGHGHQFEGQAFLAAGLRDDCRVEARAFTPSGFTSRTRLVPIAAPMRGNINTPRKSGGRGSAAAPSVTKWASGVGRTSMGVLLQKTKSRTFVRWKLLILQHSIFRFSLQNEFLQQNQEPMLVVQRMVKRMPPYRREHHVR